MSLSKLGLIGGINSFASRLRFPWLFLLFLVVFLVNLLIPDPIPMADEVLLGLGALLLSRLRKLPEPPPKETKSSLDNP